ncbi:hypothetical protein C4D60_Mb05t06320 [Musa balbisiana]|uniref:HMG box domain-containing protein n=1 Tax=Musa balbisiana TaxID=52838 RepID=A0A4S8JU47_MUSBA|nr:hypothetical protein C4D60_Mb05t06320 [Musa balbisiana]
MLPRNRGESWTARLQREATAPMVAQGGEKQSVEDDPQCEAERRQRGERLEGKEDTRGSEAICGARRRETSAPLGLAMRGGKSKAVASSKDDTKVAGKRKAAGKVDKKAKRGRKAAKDANKPKRPPSAFFIFMEEFRKIFQEKHPENKKVSVVSKACGDKWKSMSESSESSGGNASAEEEVEEEGSDKSKLKWKMWKMTKMEMKRKKRMRSE